MDKLKAMAEALKNRDEMSHQPFTPPNVPMAKTLQNYMIGVKDRMAHPLEAAAQASQDIIDANPIDTALNWSNPVGGLVGMLAGKGAKTANPLWTTVHSPRNKYLDNPDYKTPTHNQDIYGLPTKEQYEHILWKQKIDAKHAKEKFEEDMRKAIEADARHSANNGNLQPASEIPSGIDDAGAQRLKLEANRGWARK